MLTHKHLEKLGDSVVVVKPRGPYIELPKIPPSKRYFPKEHKTITPNFNAMRPDPGVKMNETPKIDNGYNNGFPNSQSMMNINTKESAINNWYGQAIDFKRRP